LTFLYIQYDEYDSAALTMIKHPVDAWDHGLFKDVIVKVANLEICYKAIEFYLESEPLRTSELLSVLVSRVDHTRVVNLVRKLGHLAVIKQYLLAVQEANILAVNTALNELYIEEEDYTHLRKSIDTYSNIDPLALARSLETHDLVEFRRIAAYLYKVRHATPRHATPRHATPRHATRRHSSTTRAHSLTHSLTHSPASYVQQNGRAEQSIELSKSDSLWKDAIDTAASSKKPELCENLLRFFVSQGRKDCFAATLYSCYDLVSPDVALELAWKNNMIDFAMPYLIQIVREHHVALNKLQERVFPPANEAADGAVALEGFVPPGAVHTSGLEFGGFVPVGSAHLSGVPPAALTGLPPPGVVPMGVVPMGVVPPGVVPMGVVPAAQPPFGWS